MFEVLLLLVLATLLVNGLASAAFETKRQDPCNDGHDWDYASDGELICRKCHWRAKDIFNG